MNITETSLAGAFILEPKVFGDHRGWFMESYNKDVLSQAGIDIDFVQDNRSFSQKKGTLRGLHCQKNPNSQAKLVTCIKGAVLDVIVDIREGSPSYLKWISVELTEENKKQLFVPKGFLHGFVTLRDDTEFSYKVDDYYSPENDRSICFCDEVFGVDWGTENPVLSEKDIKAPKFEDSDVKFFYDDFIKKTEVLK